MLDDNEQDELESAGFTITNASPKGGGVAVEYDGSEKQLRDAVPRGWRVRDALGSMDEPPTPARLERVER
jgi:hypothetical protein